MGGSLRAALALVKMYDAGLGVEPNATVAFTWLLWGQKHGIRDDDPVARQNLYEAAITFYSDVSAADNRGASAS